MKITPPDLAIWKRTKFYANSSRGRDRAYDARDHPVSNSYTK